VGQLEGKSEGTVAAAPAPACYAHVYDDLFWLSYTESRMELGMNDCDTTKWLCDNSMFLYWFAK